MPIQHIDVNVCDELVITAVRTGISGTAVFLDEHEETPGADGLDNADHGCWVKRHRTVENDPQVGQGQGDNALALCTFRFSVGCADATVRATPRQARTVATLVKRALQHRTLVQNDIGVTEPHHVRLRGVDVTPQAGPHALQSVYSVMAVASVVREGVPD